MMHYKDVCKIYGGNRSTNDAMIVFIYVEREKLGKNWGPANKTFGGVRTDVVLSSTWRYRSEHCTCIV